MRFNDLIAKLPALDPLEVFSSVLDEWWALPIGANGSAGTPSIDVPKEPAEAPVNSSSGAADGSRPNEVTKRAAAATLQAGDSDGDGDFDQHDIILTLRAGKFMTGELASWLEGDWNEDGYFNQSDIVLALQTGVYIADAQG